jgi:hypothetical protein
MHTASRNRPSMTCWIRTPLWSRRSTVGRAAGFIAALGWALVATISCGANIANAEPHNTAPEVTIGAQRAAIDHRVNAFVRGITSNTRFYGESLPRWREPICFLVGGLPKTQGEFILSRLSQIAASAGARLAPQRCRPNFFVVLTTEPDRLFKIWHHRDAGLFGDASPAQIRSFINPPKSRSVRVWHNAGIINRDGTPLIRDSSCGLPFSLFQLESPPVSCQYFPSKLLHYDVLVFSSVIIVVDIARIQRLSFGQLSDYVAMVGLAEIDLDDDVGDAPTILRLFTASSEVPPSGLTAWDQAFLSALYHSDQSSRAQRSQIAVSMLHEVSP